MKTPSKSLGTTMYLTSAKHSEFEQEEDEQKPQAVQQNPKYKDLYQKIERSQRNYKNTIQQNQQHEDQQIKQLITKNIQLSNKKHSFEKKFGASKSSNHRDILHKRTIPIVGKTQMEGNKHRLDDFFKNIQKSIQLDEKLRLIEFYLRDHDNKAHQQVNYIDKVQTNSRFRRIFLTKNAKQEKRMFHNELQYKNLQRKVYIKNDKLIETALQKVCRNAAYYRKQNFQRKAYSIEQINHNLVVNRKNQKQQKKQKEFNLIRRCFVQLAQQSESQKIYYEYIDLNNLKKIHSFLFSQGQSNSQSNPVSLQTLTQIINKIIKYKYKKVIHAQDFRQLIEVLHCQYNYHAFKQLQQREDNIILLYEKNLSINSQTNLGSHQKIDKVYNRKQLIHREIDAFKKQNKLEILKILEQNKIPIAFKAFFQKNKTNIIAQKYLPIQVITQFLKENNIVPKIIPMSKFMCTCIWHEHRHEGFDIDQFTEIQISLALMINCSIAGIYQYLKRIKIQAILSQ